MKKIIVLVAVGIASPALAADYSTPVAPVPFSWTGCYLGVHAGGVVGDNEVVGSTLGRSSSYSAAGGVAGGQIGCDYQFATGWVVGGEGRGAATNLKKTGNASVRSNITGADLPSRLTVTNEFLASLTARAGYSIANRWLVFVRGGGAWTHQKVDDAFTTVAGLPVDPSATLPRHGWTVGTGVEWAFVSGWSATLEYNFYDFGNQSQLLVEPKASVSGLNFKNEVHALTVGLNRRF
jgi:outer membrane immunogenic protein